MVEWLGAKVDSIGLKLRRIRGFLFKRVARSPTTLSAAFDSGLSTKDIASRGRSKESPELIADIGTALLGSSLCT